ncbi:hypothetical protein O9992_23170 [Vibrio lentus]|nr:hypothetical protein [Vibrio lentus]
MKQSQPNELMAAVFSRSTSMRFNVRSRWNKKISRCNWCPFTAPTQRLSRISSSQYDIMLEERYL